MFFVIFALFLLLSGSVTLKNVIIGLVLALLLTLFACLFMGYRARPLKKMPKHLLRFLNYIRLLFTEIVRSNIAVLRILYSGEEPQPLLVRFGSPLKKRGTEVLVANSITLTPGTITVSLDNGEYLVHALDDSLAEDIERCDFFRYAKALEEV